MDLSHFLNNYNARPTNPQQVAQPKQSGIYGALAQAGLNAVGSPSQQAPTNQNLFQQPEKFSYDASTDPQYQAALNLAKGNIQTSQNNTLASLVAHGQGDSSYSAGITQGIANKEMANVSNNILPQLIQQAYQHYQDGIANKFNVDSANYGVGRDNIGDNQWQKTFDAGRSDQADNLAINQGQLTGNYQSPAIAALLKEQGDNSAAWANSTPEQRATLHQRNLDIANALGQTYDTQKGTYTPAQNSIRTIAGQQLDNQISEVAYSHARDSLLDKRYQTEFDNNVKQQGFENAIKTALQAHQISNDNAQLAISQQNANTSSANGAASRANMKEDNQRTIDALKLSKTQKEFASSFIGELAGAENEDDIKLLFKGNAKELSDSLGIEAYTKLKNDALAPFQKVDPAVKQDSTVRAQAIKDAQADKRWNTKGQDRNALIAEYEAYYK